MGRDYTFVFYGRALALELQFIRATCNADQRRVLCERETFTSTTSAVSNFTTAVASPIQTIGSIIEIE
jgi:hypothetical protein